ncbi:MAG: DNA-processing protein DprA [bacterium]
MDNTALKEKLSEALALLAIPGIGCGRFQRLVDAFGSPRAVLETPIARLTEVKGITRKQATSIRELQDYEKAGRMAAEIVHLGWTALFQGDAEYPESLAQIPNAPALLFRVGQAYQKSNSMLAVVGTRHPTEQGRMLARQLAAQLAQRGIVVVSGMAEGIDSEAHLGALEAGGRTVAVWGTSLDIIFPSSNRSLAAQIRENGAIYSEYPPGTRPDRATFPQRNRIISGLCEGVVVVEAGSKSGALITAEQARDQGREVFAVPGSPSSAMSEGANQLIRQGARLITGIDDIFDELPRLRGQVSARKFETLMHLTESESRVTDLLSKGPVHVDNLVRDIGLPAPGLMELLLALELKGVVRELAGKRFVLVDEGR